MSSISMFETSYAYAVVDGKRVKMPISEYRKFMREQQKKRLAESGKKVKKAPKRKRKAETTITIIPSEIKAMLKQVKVMKSLSAYYDNGYRQWGTICRTILNLPEIYAPFLHYRSKVADVAATIEDINKIAKGNEKAVFAYVRKLSYQLDDIVRHLTALYDGVRESGVLSRFGDRECINGESRRLGLNILMKRTRTAIDELRAIITKLQERADKGIGVWGDEEHSSLRGKRILSQA